MSTQTIVRPAVPAPSTTPVARTLVSAVDLELCEALYWLRRARQRQDDVMIIHWTDRMNALLDWRGTTGPVDETQ